MGRGSIGQAPAKVAAHGGEAGPRRSKRLDVAAAGIPELHPKALFVDTADSVQEREVAVNHLCADCEPEAHARAP